MPDRETEVGCRRERVALGVRLVVIQYDFGNVRVDVLTGEHPDHALFPLGAAHGLQLLLPDIKHFDRTLGIPPHGYFEI